jgi:hypothetical protein
VGQSKATEKPRKRLNRLKLELKQQEEQNFVTEEQLYSIDAAWWHWESSEGSDDDSPAQHRSWMLIDKKQWLKDIQLKEDLKPDQKTEVVVPRLIALSNAALRLADIADQFMEDGFVNESYFKKYSDNDLGEQYGDIP